MAITVKGLYAGDNDGHNEHNRGGRGKAVGSNSIISSTHKAWTSNTLVVLSAVTLLVITTFYNNAFQPRAFIRIMSNHYGKSSVVTTATTTTTTATTATDEGNSPSAASDTSTPTIMRVVNTTTTSLTDNTTTDVATTSTARNVSTISSSSSFIAASYNNNNSNSNSSSSNSSINTPRAVGSCFHDRGKSGKWVLDWDYGNRSSYVVRGTYTDWHIASQRFRPTPQQPSRLAASYRWDDDKCPVHEVTLDKFCHICAALNVNKILILGDSLSAEFGMSLLSLLGQDFPVAFNPLFKRWHSVPCGNSNGRRSSSIVLVRIYRRSPLSDFLTLHDDPLINSTITNSPNRTVIVANTGPWIPTFEEYKIAFGALLDYIDSFPPDKIIPFIRPTIPGHPNCKPRPDLDKAHVGIKELESFDWVNNTVDEVPFENITEYRDYMKQQNSSETYNWLKFERYNDYSYGMLMNRTEVTAPTNNMTEIHWLDIFPSAILRRDGHIGFKDCLHYYLPGPVDWWSHLFFSKLVDMAEATR